MQQNCRQFCLHAENGKVKKWLYILVCSLVMGK
jgi:hypothetical protein